MDQTFCGWPKTGARRFGRRQKKTVSKGWVQAYSVANYYCCQSLHKLPAHKAQGMFGTAFLAATVKTTLTWCDGFFPSTGTGTAEVN